MKAGKMTGQIGGKVAVITGAGRGIGRALAIGFAGEGARVVCAARSQAQIDETAATIERAGGTALAVSCDVTRAEDVLPLALHLATQPLTGPSGQSFSLMRRDSQ